ncbi:unnamed protein product [Cylicostephanus goldi]|uniref:Uncharacterized protein n=1 Tax=Cylicostephanus goldi TaxID=71465 RepID=A0A3P6SW47_CYLGO|nr:unnamed protein product [Cylicostephanus goldi]
MEREVQCIQKSLHLPMMQRMHNKDSTRILCGDLPRPDPATAVLAITAATITVCNTAEAPSIVAPAYSFKEETNFRRRRANQSR